MEKRGRTRWSAPTRRGIGWRRGRWVKDTKAGWKADRRLESLPHIGHDTEGTEKTNHRGHGEHGETQTTEGTENTEIGREGADTLVRPYTAWHWVAQRAVGKGHKGLESLPHKSGLPHITEDKEDKNVSTTLGACSFPWAVKAHKPTTGMTAGVARKTACSTERPAWQAWRHAPRGGAIGWRMGRG